MLRFDSQPAYILHARPYQETSLLLELFTPDFGRLSAIAKGAKRPKARGRGVLQPFVPLIISCSGRSELLTLKDFDLASQHLVLKGPYLVSAFYLNELLMRLLHRSDAHPELFTIYAKTLQAFDQSYLEKTAALSVEFDPKIHQEKTLRLFEKALLKEIGYELHLSSDADSHDPIYPEYDYLYVPDHGPTRTPAQTQSKSVFKGSSLLAIASENFEGTSVLQDAKRLMRLALSAHLGSKPLESRRLL